MTIGQFAIVFLTEGQATAFARELAKAPFVEIGGKLDSIADQVSAVLAKQGELRMALSAAEQAIIDRFNASTNTLAALIKDLRDNPPPDDTEFNTRLTAIADGLEALGAPGQPLPPPVIEPPPPTPVP